MAGDKPPKTTVADRLGRRKDAAWRSEAKYETVLPVGQKLGDGLNCAFQIQVMHLT